MNGIWNALGEGQSAAMAASGTANAIYFARRASAAEGARRVAAAVLAGLFVGVALDGAGHLGGAAGAAAEVVQRAPLLAASVATSVLLRAGAGR